MHCRTGNRKPAGVNGEGVMCDSHSIHRSSPYTAPLQLGNMHNPIAALLASPATCCPLLRPYVTFQGITGFGSAILNLCVWVVCTSLGIDSGETTGALLLQQGSNLR
jgi:hypothetical protein